MGFLLIQALPVTNTIAVTYAAVKKIETKGARVGFRGISTLLLEALA